MCITAIKILTLFIHMHNTLPTYTVKFNLYNTYQSRYLHSKALILLILILLPNDTSIQTDVYTFTVFYFYC